MSGALALALLTGPFVTLPTPVFGGEPALMALARDPANMRLRCWSTRCGDAEWRKDAPSLATAERTPLALPGSRARARLRAPATRRDATAHYANHWRVGSSYRYQAVRDGVTQLGVDIGAGYRITPLHDDGVQGAGPVFRGELRVGQRLGERVLWTQRVQLEAGNTGTFFVKQSLGVDVQVWPHWLLESDAVIRHDNTRGASGLETAEAWLGIRRRF